MITEKTSGDLHTGDQVTLFTPEVERLGQGRRSGALQGWVSRQNGRVDFEQVGDRTAAAAAAGQSRRWGSSR